MTESDIPIFFAQQLDPDAIAMAAFPARDREVFAAHWNKILADVTVATQTIISDGNVAGNVVSFERYGKREVGYWIGKEFWGKGIATKALAAFLDHVKTRPIHARVAKKNPASIRVLEKCGFTVYGHEKSFDDAFGGELEEVLLELT